jgi:hypothetical protein
VVRLSTSLLLVVPWWEREEEKEKFGDRRKDGKEVETPRGHSGATSWIGRVAGGFSETRECQGACLRRSGGRRAREEAEREGVV